MSSKKHYSKQESTNFQLIIAALVCAFLPLIMYYHGYDNGLGNQDFYGTDSLVADFFLYWKQVVFTVSTVLFVIILLLKLLVDKKSFKLSILFIPLGVYALFTLLSLIPSAINGTLEFSISGSFEQFEPVCVLLGYTILTFYTYQYIQGEKDAHTFVRILTTGIIITILLGLSQAFFTDFFRTDFGTRLVTPEAVYQACGGKLDFNFEIGRVYLAVYNPNYVGSYVALVAPLFIMLIFTLEKIWQKVACGLIYGLLLLILFASESRAGFIGVIASLILFVVVFNRLLFEKKRWIAVVAVAVAFVALVVGYNAYSGGAITNKFKSAFSTTPYRMDITSIKTADDAVGITYRGNDFYLQMYYEDETGYFAFTPSDPEGNILECNVEADGTTFTLADPRFEGFIFSPVYVTNDIVGFCIVADDYPWNFVNFTDFYTTDYGEFLYPGYYYYTPFGKFIKMKDTDSFELLYKYSGFASGRGFLWAKTLPLMWKHFFLGSGADTFVFEFPNYDFLAMHNGGYDGMLVTKPHNMYMQIGVNSGCIALLGLLIFYCMYFFGSMKLYMGLKDKDYLTYVGIGILSGSFGYMIVQFINDSSICVAPVYWGLMGVGMAINDIIRTRVMSPIPAEKKKPAKA